MAEPTSALLVIDVQRGFDDAAFWGARNNPDCETTARMAANLGYGTTFVLDATHAFDRAGPDGVVLTADELARATATNLYGEFGRVVTTATLAAGG
jgi:nicotinamidase-related amidase